jgi:hypothetical protein
MKLPILIRIVILLLIHTFLLSCISPNYFTRKIDKTIEPDKTSDLNSVYVFVRSRGHQCGSTMCLLKRDSTNISYGIDANLRKNKILSIDNKQVLKKYEKDYFTLEEIYYIMKLFMVSNSSSMQIDSNGNIFFYRFWGIYLKKKTLEEKEIPKGYKKLKNNWYFYRYKLNE